MQAINVIDLVKRGFNRAIENIGLFLGAELSAAGLFFVVISILGILSVLISRTFGITFPLKSAPPVWGWLFMAVIFVGFLVLIDIMAMGFIRLSLRIEDGQAAGIRTLFEAKHLVWRYIGVSFLYKMIMLGGSMLFVVPGIIWGIQFSFATRVLVDREVGIIDALRASSRLTEGHKLNLFAIYLILFILNGIGSALYGIGMLFVFPIGLMISTAAYRRLAS
ncbi:hypothetical protein JW872_01600 [Candidatus Babeliales bacterium]|nr:hypothetical protein [Candidatus Babeliales bacterium]